MYEYQQHSIYFAQAPGMMEALCEQELLELGATRTTIAYRGVSFHADPATLYKINYASRLISRVLAPLKTFRCPDAASLMKATKSIQWESFFSVDQTFAITATIAKSNFTNSLYAAQCMKDGIADYFRSVTKGRRPSVSTVNPDVRLNLRIEGNDAVMSLDTSGESLHKRGYRLLAGEAPMQETLAAAIIRITGWDGENPLWDPMCGSGTLLCEALMHYCRIPAQVLRKNFGVFHMPDFDEHAWKAMKKALDEQIRPLPEGLISGSDSSREVLRVARNNLSRLPGSDAVTLACRSFQNAEPFENGTLVTNPPYGIRLGEIEQVKKLYNELGDFIKQRCKGTKSFIYTGDPSLRKSIGLKTSKRIPLVNGKLEGVLVQIDSYEGSKKKYYAEYKAEETGKSPDPQPD